MAEVEQHTDDYNDLIPESQQLAAEYQPSTALDEMMAQLKDRWFKHVEQGLLDRYGILYIYVLVHDSS